MSGQSVFVNDSSSLVEAYLSLSASGGGTIYVSEGTEPVELVLRNGGTDPVRITSADPLDPVELTNIKLSNVESVTVDSVGVNSSSVTDRDFRYDMEIWGSSGVKIHNVTFKGEAEGFPESGDLANSQGLIRNSSDVEFSDNTVSHYAHGLFLRDSFNVSVKDNDISQLQADGLRMEGVQGVRIEANNFHDFFGSPNSSNHDDMIQMWAVNTEIISGDIEIIGNTFISGDGPASQTIFLGNEMGRGNPDLAYENITISENIIYNAHKHGIKVADARNVLVEDNTLLWDADATMSGKTMEPQINFSNVENGQIINNIASSIPSGTEHTVSGNRIVEYDDVTSPDYFEKHFANLQAVGEVDLRDLALLPDSTWVGSGAPMSQPSADDGANQAVIMARQTPDDIWQWSFDASLSTFQGSDPSFVWTFADGTTLEGASVTHSFAGSGVQDVRLNVLDNGQTLAVLDRSFEIDKRDFVDFDFKAAGLDDLADNGARVKDLDAANLGENGYRIGGTENFQIDRATDTIHNLTNFGIEIELDPVHTNDSGTFLHFHKVMSAQVMDDGSVAFDLQTDEGSFEVRSDAGIFSDGSAHLIGIAYDNQADQLSLHIDGETVSSTTASGTTAPKISWGLTIGHTWQNAIEADVGSFYFGYDLGGPPLANGSSGQDAPVVEDEPVIVDDPLVEEDPVIEEPAAEEPAEDPAVEDPVEEAPPSSPMPREGADGSSDPIGFSEAAITVDFEQQMMDGTHAMLTEVHRGHLEFDVANAAGYRIGGGESLTIPRSIDELHNLEGFRLEVEMGLDSLGSEGTFVHMHNVMQGRVLEDGSVNFQLETDEGHFELNSVRSVFNDLETHNFGLVYDGAGGTLEMYADGELVGSTEATGMTADRAWHGLTFGHAWDDGLDAWIDGVRFEPGAGPAEDTEAEASVSYFDALLESMVEDDTLPEPEEDFAESEEAMVL